MKIEPLGISGAWVCTPSVHPDDRGAFLEWFRGDRLAAATRRRFDVVQANHSISQQGVVRGIHFADVPPGQAKYVYCARGAVLDVIVDIRVGSPTFGEHVAVMLDEVDRRGVFIAEGLGHGFCALTDESSVAYLVSSPYNASAERTVSPVDAELQLPWPEGTPLLLSDKDRDAPSLATAAADGILPTYDSCVSLYESLRHS
ncbi:MAG: dTDP-4-dehydrorhamnose 3,5-epimerase family protein [Frankiaceae bacterium]|nr:dTDP-4-dehydrorhamnose 3,5-epimerase family protein [Frankiaceae bacterium]MBV9871493.1 dTDP-4-dehydrorhamnose 3,5-epimerase family protein [Frankiaceae bacterium]